MVIRIKNLPLDENPAPSDSVAVDGSSTRKTTIEQLVAASGMGELAATAVQPGDLGTSAPLDVGTTAGTVAAGDDERIVNALQYTVRSGTAAQIQAAIDEAPSGASVLVRLSGEISMPTSVTENGRDVSFEIDPGTIFTGPGTLPEYGSPSFFDVNTKNIALIMKRGTASSPVTDSTEPLAV